jgi:hypothetical protein
VKTGKRGTAKLWLTIKRPGVRRASASMPGMRRAVAHIRIRR